LFSSFWVYSPLKNLFSLTKGREKRRRKNRNFIDAYLHTGHDKSFGVPGAKRQTTNGARAGHSFWSFEKSIIPQKK